MKLIAILVLISSFFFNVSSEIVHLPDKVKPKSYKLELTLKEDAFTTNVFTGSVVIELTAANNTQSIILNKAASIKITSIFLKNGAYDLKYNQSFDSENEMLNLTLDKNLIHNRTYTLKIEYTGLLNIRNNQGFYKSSYEKSTGEVINFAMTNFKPNYARHLLPCFDEPSFKSVFSLTVYFPSKYRVVGNTQYSLGATGGQMIARFDPTPLIPTYLLGFIISDLTNESGVKIGANKIPFKVFSRNDINISKKYALDLGPQLIGLMSEWTGLGLGELDLKKLDQVGVPDLGESGEFWGFNIYRESDLLWDPKDDSILKKQQISLKIAYQIALHWIGNVVTPKWWSDWYLSAGLATFFQYYLVQELEPKWQVDNQFFLDQCQTALQSDFSIIISDEQNDGLSTILFSKASCIFKMVESIIGKPAFRKGIRQFLEENRFGAATPGNLMKNWQNQIDNNSLPANLEEILHNWMYKPGFPLLTLKIKGDDVIITQSNYYTSQNVTWFVPFSLIHLNTTKSYWLKPGKDLTIKNALLDSDWFILNNRQNSYFRVDYGDFWTNISQKLHEQPKTVDDLTRAQLIYDFFNLAKINKYPYSKVFDFVGFLGKDISYYSWRAALDGIEEIWHRISSNNTRKYFSSFVLNLMSSVYKSVSFYEDTNDHVLLLKKKLILTWACRLELEDCIENSKRLYNHFLQTQKKPDPNIRSVIYCTSLHQSTFPTHDFNYLWNEYLETQSAIEKETILISLGCVKDSKLLNNLLEKSITKSSGMRREDGSLAFQAVYTNNPEGIDLALDFLIDNHLAVISIYGVNKLVEISKDLVERFNKQEQVDKLEKFGEVSGDFSNVVSEMLVIAKSNLARSRRFEAQMSANFRNTGAVTRNDCLLVLMAFWFVLMVWELL